MTVLNNFSNHGQVPECLPDAAANVKQLKPVNRPWILTDRRRQDTISNISRKAASKPPATKAKEIMKTLLTTLTVISLSLVGFSQQAEARGHSSRVYVSSYQPCGTPVYSERYLVGYDRCGNPVWGTRTIRQRYRPVARPVRRATYHEPAYVAPRGGYYHAPRGGVSVSYRGSRCR